MKKRAFYLSLIVVVTITTFAITKMNTYAAEETWEHKLTTRSSPTPLPNNYWIPFNQGGFGTFSNTATGGNEGMHNMARATITNQLYFYLQDSFNRGDQLGYRQGDSISRELNILSSPRFFHATNQIERLGYSNHRGWNNVWRYQNGGNLGAGRHDDSQNMAWFTPFPNRTIRTVDGTIELSISYINSTRIRVTLTRLRTAPSTNPSFTSDFSVSLPIEMAFNRWNAAGTRVNDYTARDNVAIFNRNRGPLAAWDISSYLQPLPQLQAVQ